MTQPATTNTRLLLKNAVTYACGDGSSAVVNLLVFTLLLRFLSPNDFGYLSIGQSVSTWVQPVLYMGANLIAARLFSISADRTFILARRMITIRFLAAAAVSAITIAVALHSTDKSLRSVLLAYSLLFLLYPVQPDFIAIGLNRAHVYRVSRWVASACFICLVMLLTRFSLRAWMVPIAYAVGLFVSAVYGLIRLCPLLQRSGTSSDTSLSVVLRGALVVVAAQFFQMGQACLDTILMKAFKVPVSMIGDYSAIARLAAAACLPFLALIYSLAPLYVQELAKANLSSITMLERKFRLCLLGAGIIAGAGIVAFGPEVLQLVSGRPMISTRILAPVFALICVIVALHNSYTAILVYGGATHFYLATYVVGLIATFISGMVLVPRFGPVGAAVAELAGYSAILVVGYFLHAKFVRQQYQAGLVLAKASAAAAE